VHAIPAGELSTDPPAAVVGAADRVPATLRVSPGGAPPPSNSADGRNHLLVIPPHRDEFRTHFLYDVLPNSRTRILFANHQNAAPQGPINNPCPSFTMYRSVLPPQLEDPSEVVFETRVTGSRRALTGGTVSFTIPGLPVGIYWFTCGNDLVYRGSISSGVSLPSLACASEFSGGRREEPSETVGEVNTVPSPPPSFVHRLTSWPAAGR